MVKHILTKILLAILYLGFESSANGLHIGISPSSSVTVGRSIPALDAGISFGDNLLSVMTTGIKSKAYYYSAYNINFFPNFQKWGDSFFGAIHGGLGLGLYISRKEILRSIAENQAKADNDQGFGPAFRIEAQPTDFLYIGIEYTMGLGVAVLGGGWGEFGAMSLGVRL